MTPAAVLDTNVVLDWLVFRDPAALALAGEICAGRLVWRATEAMRTEFGQVLARPALAGWQPDAVAAAASWQRHAHIDPVPATCPLVCHDPDDQIFIDLAMAARCRWLLSRDRALLKLAPRARIYGIAIVTPRGWTSMFAPTAQALEA